MQTIEDRLWSKVDKSGECWVWTGGAARHGYGVIGIGSRTDNSVRKVGVHRLVYEMEVGPIPPGMAVCHSCDNPPCVRPSHLFIGTQKDNIRDALSKGRLSKPPDTSGEHNPRAILSPQDVSDIRNAYACQPRTRSAGGTFAKEARITQRSLAEKYNVSVGTISAIVIGRNWKKPASPVL